jgi:hypothetical protein
MKTRFIGALGAAMATAVMLVPVLPAAQGGGRGDINRTCAMVRDYPAFHQCAIEKMNTFDPPRTPDGRPDFNGIWMPTRTAQDIEEIKPGMYGGNFNSKTLVVEPADGKIPYQPWAQTARHKFVDEYVSPTALCLPVGPQRLIYSPVSITGFRFILEPKYFVMSMERLHTFRVVPLDNRPQLSPTVKLWGGDARGHWDGNTLVMVVTNQNDLTWFDHIGTFMSSDAKLEERLTFVDANTLHYEERIEDPSVFTQPWKIAIPLLRQPAKGMDALDLEDTTVENCDNEIHHFLDQGQKPFPGYAAVAPKKRATTGGER